MNYINNISSVTNNNLQFQSQKSNIILNNPVKEEETKDSFESSTPKEKPKNKKWLLVGGTILGTILATVGFLRFHKKFKPTIEKPNELVPTTEIEEQVAELKGKLREKFTTTRQEIDARFNQETGDYQDLISGYKEAEALEREQAYIDKTFGQKTSAQESASVFEEQFAKEKELKLNKILEDFKIKTPRSANLSENINIGLDFGEDMVTLIKGKTLTPESMQKLVEKHFNTDKIQIRSMAEYDGPSSKKMVAAVTRPTFNEAGLLEKMEIFIPEVNYSNTYSMIDYAAKTTHEITHASQFLKLEEPMNYMMPSTDAKLMNFIQKRITDFFTDQMGSKALKGLMAEKNMTSFNSYDELYAFYDSATQSVTRSNLGKILKIGSEPAVQKQNINEIFNMIFDDIAGKFHGNPDMRTCLDNYGGYEGFRGEIKRICADSFKQEVEAYKAEQMLRQELTGTVGTTTNYDFIHTIMGILSDSLK